MDNPFPGLHKNAAFPAELPRRVRLLQREVLTSSIAHIGITVLAVLAFISVAGCGKPESGSAPASPAASALSPDAVIRIHWLGKDRLGIEASAYYFSRILNLPETKTLQLQTIVKLATVPWRLAAGESQRTNLNSLFLQPLLNDVVRKECYLETRQLSNQREELAFAIRLDAPRAGLWQTNLANILHSLTGVWPITSPNNGWTLRWQHNPGLIELVRAGDWVVVGASEGDNQLLHHIIDRIKGDPVPFGARTSADWLQADIDLRRMSPVPAIDWIPLNNLPRISLTLNGDGGHVITHGEVIFPEPIAIQLEPWSIPAKRIAEPLVSFTAIRGIKPALESWKPWNDLQIGPAPNQLCFWGLDGIPLQMLMAAPEPDAGKQVLAVTDALLRNGNLWLTNHGVGQFEAIPESKGVIWMGLPSISPFIRSVDDGRMIICGLDTHGGQGTNTQNGINYRPSLVSMLEDLSAQTNLLCYDWELTAPRIESCLFDGQILRAALRHPPLPMDSASVNWLRTVKDRLGNSTTHVTLSAPNQLTFDRRSSIGFTGAELNLLVDWLESPQFPIGFYSTSPADN
jgi:hypothetical protein